MIHLYVNGEDRKNLNKRSKKLSERKLASEAYASPLSPDFSLYKRESKKSGDNSD
jgi:hypothetical protein